MKNFEKNVFINCPFDPDYRQLLITLIFTIKDIGYIPRISLENANSAETRILKILDLIKESKFGIHDLSRLKSTDKDEHFRMNMPFELGIDYGCMKYKNGKWSEKKLLVLEKEQYRYQAALSDFSGSDIRHHNDKPMELIKEVRDWFVVTEGLKKAESHRNIWYRFNDFIADLEINLAQQGYEKDDFETVPIPEVMTYMYEWLNENHIAE
ncbi:MAG: hypothetical protein KAS04_05970 [Candidatus Aenigmarchaeota archaeon]|nr:hypothetical protein [Candidatus Aenigmarchaeota archaeon]